MGRARRRQSTLEKIHKLWSSEDEIDRTYADLLAIAIDTRISMGLTQSQLAKETGIAVSMISKIENGGSIPSVKIFLKYLNGLNLHWSFAYKKSDK
ncbi:helix-turn-helix transcriptional regulator [Thalassobacillus sp. C254]|uniref:helix-turn-helix domain-containing protein n=1 Tax=Thalassobacillus sp. C254 TaxID=1225341 RepID=UPI0006D08447|nr:helix-turn-helix transcriptional regulator [Thalassobacillus sp. C254]